jgi:hypothetical protein
MPKDYARPALDKTRLGQRIAEVHIGSSRFTGSAS